MAVQCPESCQPPPQSIHPEGRPRPCRLKGFGLEPETAEITDRLSSREQALADGHGLISRAGSGPLARTASSDRE